MSPIRSPTLVSGVAGHRQPVAELGGKPPAARAGRRHRVIVDLAAGDRRRPLVQQAGEGADQTRLALAALAEQDHVVPGDQGALQVRQHGLAEADDAGEWILAGPHRGDQVLPDLFLDAARLLAAGTQLADSGDGRSWLPGGG
jgi:hypothetical protein